MNKLYGIMLLTIALLLAPNAWATDYYLRGDGTVTAANKANATGCSSASTAMDAEEHNLATFSPGDTIYFCDDGGAFDNIVVPSSGSSGNPITYINAPGDTPEIVPTAPNAYSFYAQYKDYITISGLSITAPAYDRIVWLEQCDNLIFTYNTVHDGRGMSWAGENATISYNTFEDCEYQRVLGIGATLGIVNPDADDLTTISYNTFTSNNDDTFALTDGEDIGVSGASIDAFHPIKHVIVEHNLFQDGQTLGHNHTVVVYNASDVIIRYNTITNMGCAGIGATNSDNVQIYYNAIINNDFSAACTLHAAPIDIKQASGGCETCTITEDIYVYNNVIANNDIASDNGLAKSSITMYADTGLTVNNVEIRNNILANNWASENDSGWAIYNYGMGTISNLTMSNNLYYRTANLTNFIRYGLVSPSTNHNDYTYAQFAAYQSAESQDANSIQGNPLFVNADTDFMILPSSPCRDAGVSVGLTRDLAGSVVPLGPYPDIGAHEYFAGSISGCTITGGRTP